MKAFSLLGAAITAMSFLHPLAAQPEAPAPSVEQTEADARFQQLLNLAQWTTSGAGNLGDKATIEVPEGFRFTGSSGTVKLMEAFGNLTSGKELGYLSPLEMGWFAVFEFDPVGYVKDDEKDDLDPDAILEQLREGQLRANSELVRLGRPTLSVEGWQKPPFYNPETKNLEWAIRIRSSDGGEIVNYKTKLLGRRGVMDVVLVCGEDELDTVVPTYQKLLTGFSFKKEESYAAFRDGDKIAEYGLTGLIVGGGLLVAAKSGLLAKLWKPIAIGVVAVGAFLKRIFTGKKDNAESI